MSPEPAKYASPQHKTQSYPIKPKRSQISLDTTGAAANSSPFFHMDRSNG